MPKIFHEWIKQWIKLERLNLSERPEQFARQTTRSASQDRARMRIAVSLATAFSEKSMLRQKQVRPLTDELCDPVHRGEQPILSSDLC